jgi:hypothetical protein
MEMASKADWEVWTEVSSKLGWRWLVRMVGRFKLRFLAGWDGDGWKGWLVGLDRGF